MPKAEYKYRKYEVVPYDAAWPKQFAAEAAALKRIFGKDAIAIEHIGSTAVPGMDGKPTIDILILVNELALGEKHAEEMNAAGYQYLAGYVSPNSILFRRMKDGVLLSNVHVFEKGHPHVRAMLALRDYLRANPAEVRAYSKIKRELFRKYPSDYGEYRRLKDAYMEEMKKRMEAGK